MIGEGLVSQPGLTDCDPYGKQGTCFGFPVVINAKIEGDWLPLLAINARHRRVFPFAFGFTTGMRSLEATHHCIVCSCLTSLHFFLFILLTVFVSAFVLANV